MTYGTLEQQAYFSLMVGVVSMVINKDFDAIGFVMKKKWTWCGLNSRTAYEEALLELVVQIARGGQVSN